MSEDKKFPHDDSFPDNVNPTEEARKEWSDKIEKDRKADEKAAEKGDDAPVHEANLGYGDPSLADKDDSKTKTGQTKTTSGKK